MKELDHEHRSNDRRAAVISAFVSAMIATLVVLVRDPALSLLPLSPSWTGILTASAIFVAGGLTWYIAGYFVRAGQSEAIRRRYEDLRTRSELLLAHISDNKIGR